MEITICSRISLKARLDSSAPYCNRRRTTRPRHHDGHAATLSAIAQHSEQRIARPAWLPWPAHARIKNNVSLFPLNAIIQNGRSQNEAPGTSTKAESVQTTDHSPEGGIVVTSRTWDIVSL